MKRLAFLLAGMVFGAGLTLSRMIDPAKVIGFLDIGGAWDPSLAATMATAVATTVLLYAMARRRAAPLLGGAMPPPPSTIIDSRLIGGSAVFGLGWGLAGICPAPGIAVSVLNPTALWFLVGLTIGVLAHRLALIPRACNAMKRTET
jgi:uncharacterized membrane protein YedE/YeeE